MYVYKNTFNLGLYSGIRLEINHRRKSIHIDQSLCERRKELDGQSLCDVMIITELSNAKDDKATVTITLFNQYSGQLELVLRLINSVFS